MMNIARSLLMLLFLMICCGFVACSLKPENPQDKAISKINQAYPLEIEKRFDLQLDSVGISAMEEIKVLAYGFTSREHVHEAEATELVCKCTEILLEMINQDEEIRPYLIHYPFTSKDVQVGILFSDETDDNFVSSEFIATSSAYQGEVILRNYQKETGRLNKISSVPYDQAIKSLKASGRL